MIYQYVGLAIFILLTQNAYAESLIPERRTNQYLTQMGYFVTPLPYSIPGIGSGVIFLGNFSNVKNTTTDINVLTISGDAGGTMFFAEEIPLKGKWLSMETSYQNINRANINVYSKRGMDGVAKDDFNIMEMGLFKKLHNALILDFYEKRFSFIYNHDIVESRIDALKDNEGKFLNTLYIANKDTQNALDFQIDFTDDKLDPRRGVRFDLSYQNHEAKDSKSPDMYVLDYNLSGYLPMGKHSTLALNYFQSDAHVTREGETDLDAIRNELDPCDPTDNACISARESLVLNYYNERKYGTATDMGGNQRLRSYPGSRFQGAHSGYFAAEFRWNFMQKATPFNYWIWRDVRTGIQTAFFLEAASVSERSSELWNEKRYSSGVGLRLITASGGVYRADFATGSEGSELSVIFNYPW